jgi:hypothetical protein
VALSICIVLLQTQATEFYVFSITVPGLKRAGGAATGNGLGELRVGVRIQVEAFVSSPRRPDWFWGLSSLLCNRYRRGFFPGGKETVA